MISLIILTKKLRVSAFTLFPHSHIASNWQSWDLNPGDMPAEPVDFNWTDIFWLTALAFS